MLNYLYQLYIYLRFSFKLWRNRKDRTLLKRLKIMSSQETVDYILDNHCSVCRFGDGEFDVMGGGKNGFQDTDLKLADRLKCVITSNNKSVLLCIPKTFNDRKNIKIKSVNYILSILIGLRDRIFPFLSTDYTYGDANFSRFYMMKRDKSNVPAYVLQLKKIWDKKNLLIVEGESSCLGVCNDLFDNASQIRRIICPSSNAFSSYDKILSSVTKHRRSDELVLISLGMTATVLAFDLAMQNIQAIDIGHIDIEYEWMKTGATEKVAIPYKSVNEVAGGRDVSPNTNPDYLLQILCRIR